MGVRGVDHLLDTMHVGGKRRDHDAALGLGEQAIQHGADLHLGHRETGDLRVGGVHHEEVQALLADARERPQVRDAAIERQLVHLEVTRVEHGSGGGAHHHGQGIGNGMVDGDELQAELPDLLALALLDRERERLDAVLLELGVHKGERQLGADERDVPAHAQQVGHGADVVLVTVGEDHGLDVVETVLDVAEVGQDQVDAGLVVLGEQHAAVDDEQAAPVLQDGHVATHLAEPSQGDDAQGVIVQGGGCGQFGVKVHGSPLSEVRALPRRSVPS